MARPGMYRLRLYVSGQAPHSRRAIINLRDLCALFPPDLIEVEIIDVADDPRAAEADKILATPTLVRKTPEPVRKIIGDLSEADKVFLGLGLWPGSASEGAGMIE